MYIRKKHTALSPRAAFRLTLTLIAFSESVYKQSVLIAIKSHLLDLKPRCVSYF